MSDRCGECGAEDCDPDYVECCGVYMCEFCLDKHDDKWGVDNEE